MTLNNFYLKYIIFMKINIEKRHRLWNHEYIYVVYLKVSHAYGLSSAKCKGN